MSKRELEVINATNEEKCKKETNEKKCKNGTIQEQDKNATNKEKGDIIKTNIRNILAEFKNLEEYEHQKYLVKEIFAIPLSKFFKFKKNFN